MGQRTALACLAIVLAATGPARAGTAAPAPLEMEDALQRPHDEVERRLPTSHPSCYFFYAERLVGENQRAAALRWFHVGEVRYRYLLAVTQGSESEAASLYASLHEVVGRVVNAQAGADPSNWVRQIDAALAWDAAHDDVATPHARHAAEWQAARATLGQLRDYVATHGEEIRRQREAAGMGEIGVVDGVYVEERRPPMPADWPALLPATTPAALGGAYAADPGIVAALAGSDARGRRATVLELGAESDARLVVVLRDATHEVDRAVLDVRAADGAVVFERAKDAADVDGRAGRVREQIALRRNVAGELVMRREVRIEGSIPGKDMQQRLDFVDWSRAPASAP